jgi:hypothetical protein
MLSTPKTILNILVDVLASNYSEYYNRYSNHDFLSCLDDHTNSDNMAYLMEHVRKLNKKDPEYLGYLKHCYAIHIELHSLIRMALEEEDQHYIQLIRRSFMIRSIERLHLLDLAVHDSESMDKLCKEVKNDPKEFLSEVVLNIVENYKDFKKEKNRKITNLNAYSDFFLDSFNDLSK